MQIDDINNLDGAYIPNWFYKEHFERWIKKKLTNEEFKDIQCKLDDTDIADQISILIYEYLMCFDDQEELL